MKLSHTTVVSVGMVGLPKASYGGRGADRMPFVQTVSGAAMCVEVVGFAMRNAMAGTNGSSAPAVRPDLGGSREMQKRPIGRIERESNGIRGEEST